MIDRHGKGLLLYMNQEGRGIGLLNKLKAHQLQEQGWTRWKPTLKLGFGMDERDYGVGAQILRHLGITNMRLMTNNLRKRAGILAMDSRYLETVPIEMKPNEHNENIYLPKRDKLGHEDIKWPLTVNSNRPGFMVKDLCSPFAYYFCASIILMTAFRISHLGSCLSSEDHRPVTPQGCHSSESKVRFSSGEQELQGYPVVFVQVDSIAMDLPAFVASSKQCNRCCEGEAACAYIGFSSK